MKLSVNKLRNIIRLLLTETLDLENDPEYKDRYFGDTYRKHDDNRRAYGIQSKEEIKDEKEHLRKYSSELDPKLKGKFMNGEYTICHGLNYQTYTDGPRESNLRKWFEKFGLKGKDTLSCTAYASDVESLTSDMMYGSNHDSVFSGAGLLLKGYPVFISAQKDLMSQTLSSIPEKLKDYQKSSGIAKRTNPLNKGVTTDKEFQSIQAANEVLLDNWTVVGVYMTYDMYDEYAVDDELYDMIEEHFGGVHIIEDLNYEEFIEH